MKRDWIQFLGMKVSIFKMSQDGRRCEWVELRVFLGQ